MLLRWFAVLTLFGALTLPVFAEERDAPLPFDDPAAAPVLAKPAPVAKAKARQPRSKGVTPATAHQAKPVKGKVLTKKTAAKKPLVNASKKRVPSKPAVKKTVSKKPVSKKR